ncbi:MAG: hypothetical protein EBS23_02935 [Betaproteobacteria bacterium]|nr:hypothetical protein [Betaproteobacteria bacterium]
MRNQIVLLDSPLPVDRLPAIEAKANRLARELDQRVALVLSDRLGTRVAQGWEFWDKLLFAQSLGGLVEWMNTGALAELPSKVAICHFRNPQDYFHPSVIRANIIARALKRAGKEVVRIPLDYPLRLPHRPDVWACSYRVETPRHLLDGARLVHCPSALYAGEQLHRRYGGPGYIDLQSPYYDVELGRQRITLRDPQRPTAGVAVPIDEISHLYASFLQQLGLEQIPGVELQMEHWCQRLRFQMRAFKLLSVLRSRHGVVLEALADHDGGLFGPLCSAFGSQSHPVTVIPHTTVCVGPLPNLPVRTHAWMDALKPYKAFDGGTLPLPDFVQKPAQIAGRGSVVALILNEMDNVGGVAVHGYQSLINFVERLAEALRAGGYHPVLRPRPSSPVHFAHRFEVELHQGDIGTLVARAAVCIGIGQATSAVLKFWRDGVHCLHVQEAGLSVSDEYTLPREGVWISAGKTFAESLPAVLDYVDIVTGRQRGGHA